MKNVFKCIALLMSLGLTGCSLDSMFSPTPNSVAPPPPPPPPTAQAQPLPPNQSMYQQQAMSSGVSGMAPSYNGPGVPPGPMASNVPRAATPSNIGSGSMDGVDRTKFSRALDSGIGRSTHWLNANTNISYTVTPTKKVDVNGNSFCRMYNLTTIKGDQTRETSGTACVTPDGAWQSV